MAERADYTQLRTLLRQKEVVGQLKNVTDIALEASAGQL